MKYFTFKHRLGFTMLELVFAIVVLGILAALAMPRLDRDFKQDAADSILSDIRYTQHLALMDDIYEHNIPTWQRKWWRIGFQQCAGGAGAEWFETISSDRDMQGDIDAGEAAIDPSNGKDMDIAANNCNAVGVNENVLLTKKYGITNITSTCHANNRYVGFDHLGRPHSGFLGSMTPDYASYINDPSTCIFTFTMSDNTTFQIDIAPETGYAFILNQNNS